MTKREVEVKLEVLNPDLARAVLASHGLKLVDECYELDAYYSHPCRNFTETDEALRLRMRRCKSGESYAMTYKGPREKGLPAGLKAREELELRLDKSAWETLSEVLAKLGFSHVAVFSKTREIYEGSGVSAFLDLLHGVGYYLELELSTPSGEELAKLIVSRLLAQARIVEETYLEICLKTKKCIAMGLEVDGT